VTDARTRQKFLGKVCLISGLWWILWFKSNALEANESQQEIQAWCEISVSRFGCFGSRAPERELDPGIWLLPLRIRKSVWSTPLPQPITSAELIPRREKYALQAATAVSNFVSLSRNFLPVSCRGYNAAHVTADTTAKWSTINSYRRNDLGRKCTCQIGVTAAIGFARIECRPFLLLEERDAAPRPRWLACLFSSLKSFKTFSSY